VQSCKAGVLANKPEWLSSVSKGRRLDVKSRVRPQDGPFEALEPYDVKVARTVLRRRSGREPRDLSGCMLLVSNILFFWR